MEEDPLAAAGAKPRAREGELENRHWKPMPMIQDLILRREAAAGPKPLEAGVPGLPRLAGAEAGYRHREGVEAQGLRRVMMGNLHLVMPEGFQLVAPAGSRLVTEAEPDLRVVAEAPVNQTLGAPGGSFPQARAAGPIHQGPGSIPVIVAVEGRVPGHLLQIHQGERFPLEGPEVLAKNQQARWEEAELMHQPGRDLPYCFLARSSKAKALVRKYQNQIPHPSQAQI